MNPTRSANRTVTSRRSATGASRGDAKRAGSGRARAECRSRRRTACPAGSRRRTRGRRAPSGAPQSPQKRFPAGFSLPQAAQVTRLSLIQLSRIASIARTSDGWARPRSRALRGRGPPGSECCVARANRAAARSRWPQAGANARATRSRGRGGADHLVAAAEIRVGDEERVEVGGVVQARSPPRGRGPADRRGGDVDAELLHDLTARSRASPPRRQAEPAGRSRTRPHRPWPRYRPRRSSIVSLRRHFGDAFTCSWRKTEWPSSASTCGRAPRPISRTIVPPFPIRICFWLSVSV